jgi:hypothetical protein
MDELLNRTIMDSTTLSLGTSLKSTDLPKASLKLQFVDVQELNVGLDAAVGVATRYCLDGPAIESRWG